MTLKATFARRALVTLVALGGSAVGLGLVIHDEKRATTAAILAALTYIGHQAFDPGRLGFWHSRRLRPIGLALTALALFGAPLAPTLIPALALLSIAARHWRGSHALVSLHSDDVETLRQKVVLLESDLHNTRTAAAREPRDRAKKAS